MFEQFSLDKISLVTYASAFLFGTLICFTPCVYPVLPVLLGYMGATQIKTRKEGFLKSFAYVLGMAFTYSLLGAIAALSGGIFGLFQRNFWVNLVIANIFIILGLFMLDVFQMPQVVIFKNTPQGDKLRWGGIFLVGAASGLVIGPCTTPVLGAILAYVAAKHNVIIGMSLLFTYALGMGFPLLVLGTFVGLLKKMPKTGEWMLKIKKLFGFLLIAAGEYFLVGMR